MFQNRLKYEQAVECCFKNGKPEGFMPCVSMISWPETGRLQALHERDFGD